MRILDSSLRSSSEILSGQRYELTIKDCRKDQIAFYTQYGSYLLPIV
jgi:hypothetical protein